MWPFRKKAKGPNKTEKPTIKKADAKSWCDDYIRAIKVRTDMNEEYQDIGAWMEHREEYEKRLREHPPIPIEHAEMIIAGARLTQACLLPLAQAKLRKRLLEAQADISSKEEGNKCEGDTHV